MLIQNNIDIQLEKAIDTNKRVMTNSFKQVVFIGPEHSQRGGIASVLDVYSKAIPEFNFIATYHNKGAIRNLMDFLGACCRLLGMMVTQPSIKILHLHAASKGSFYRKSILLLIGKLFGRKSVLHIHAGGFKDFYNGHSFFQPFIRYILNNTDVLICLSDEWKQYFDSITNKPHAIVVNNPVILPGEVHTKQPGKICNILFLNHLLPTKGIFDLVKFFAEHKDWLQQHFKLIVAGDGDQAHLKNLMEENDLYGLVEYKGWVSGKAKDELINNSDVFILPSYFEGLPMSILESMAHGKPIIATNVGGIPRVVKDRQNGWLISPGDLKGLKEALQEIAASPGTLNQYGLHSLQLVKAYSPEKVVEHLHDIYATLQSNAK